MKNAIKNIIIAVIMISVTAFFAFIGINYSENALVSFFAPKTTATETTKKATVPTTTKKITTTKKTTATATTTQEATAKPTTTKVPDITLPENMLIDYMPLSLYCGSGDIKHCQGMAIDIKKGYTYYSYTNSLIKCDLDGNLIGSIIGVNGHLGDIAFNPEDGLLYASLNPPDKPALYTAIINPDEITKENMKASNPKIFRTVHLKTVWEDFSARVETNVGTMKRRYGVSGTDAMTFGPSFSTGKGHYLTVSCGTTPQIQRTDNDYQVLIQYDVTDWWEKYGQPMPKEGDFHHIGPEGCHGKFFAYTGNTNYGVQTMTYFEELKLWLMFVYPTTKEDFTKYTLYIIDGDIPPKKTKLKGQAKKDVQNVLTLYCDGDYDKEHDIYGWFAQNGSRGIQSIGGGMFYIIHPYRTWFSSQTAVAYLYVWDPSKADPFTLASDVKTDYAISKKLTTTTNPTTTKKAVTTKKATTAKAVTTAQPTTQKKAENIFEFIFGR